MATFLEEIIIGQATMCAMNEPNQRPTIDEVFPILARIESVPIEICKAAYDILDTSSPGEQMDSMNKYAHKFGSAREVIECLFPDMEVEKYSRVHFEYFALAIEYMRRRAQADPRS